jgi:ketosteroid isomerase-like protein
MSHQDDTIPIEPSERRAGAGPPPASPNFDARSVRRARAAVPLRDGGSRWDGRLPWIVVALVAGMVGGLVGIWALSYYDGADGNTRAVSNSSAPAATNARPAASPTATRVDAAAQPQTAGANDQAQAGDAAPGGVEDAPPTEEPAGASRAGEAEELRGALAGWIDATNARDIDRQMSFYEARLGTFYLARDATRQAVRAEKSAAFARASRVDVRADAPQIFLSRDGRTATMRFRKQFAIEGGGQDRRGAVLQELRWRRTARGWKIVGERDLRVID